MVPFALTPPHPMQHHRGMDPIDDLVTIETAGRTVGIPPSAIGYWIVTGQLQSSQTPEGRLVSLTAVRSLAPASNLPTLSPRTSGWSRPTAHTPRIDEDPDPNSPNRPESLQSSIRLARIERRMADVSATLNELRELLQTQNATIEALRDLLASAAPSMPVPTVVDNEPSPYTGDPLPEEPRLTIRLRRTSETLQEEIGPPSAPSPRRNPPVEHLRLTRDSDLPAPPQPRSNAHPRLIDQPGELA